MFQLTLESLAERVAVIEKILAEMRQAESRSSSFKDWRRTIGMFAGDEVMKEIFEAGRQIREADREECNRE